MNQHYVPRVYLKNFAKQRGSEYYVDVYDKVTEKIFNTNIKNICSEKDLYTLEDNSISTDSLLIENIYAKGLEPMYQDVFEILTNDNKFWITDQERNEILMAIFQLYMRNPKIMRNTVANHASTIKRLVSNAISNGEKGVSYLDEDFSFREWNEETIIIFLVMS